MKKFDRDLFYDYMDEIIPNMDKNDLKKLEFVKSFILKYIEIDGAEGDPLVVITPLHYKVLLYVVFSIILDYEATLGKLDN